MEGSRHTKRIKEWRPEERKARGRPKKKLAIVCGRRHETDGRENCSVSSQLESPDRSG